MKFNLSRNITYMFSKRILFLLLVVYSMPTFSGELSDAKEAYDSNDVVTAFVLYEKLAEQGNVVAQNNIAYMHYNGIGTPQDYQKSFSIYEVLAEQGLVAAQTTLAAMYVQGQLQHLSLMQQQVVFGPS